jgi:hypothetical protein
MKKQALTALFVTSLMLSQTSPVAAVARDATPAATPTTSASAQLEDLKERLATKVAALRDVVKRAVYGTVSSVSISSATLDTKTKTLKVELSDQVSVAQVINGKRTTLSLDDVSRGDPITVFGTYDTTLDLLKAQFIFIESPSTVVRISGTVTAVDQKAFTLTVNTPEGRTLTVDFEKSTKTTQWDKNNGIVKAGFSKIVAGDTVHISGTMEPKKEDRMSAARILDIGNLSGSVVTPTATSTPESSASATPTRASVRTTPRATPTP